MAIGTNLTKTPAPRNPQDAPAPAHVCVQPAHTCVQTCNCCKFCINRAWEECGLIVLVGGVLLPCIIDYVILDKPSDGIGLGVLGVCFWISVTSAWRILPYRLRTWHTHARNSHQHTHI